jgi:hypothetical protein
MKTFRKMSRENQKLLYWLINDFACHLASREPGQNPGDFWKHKAKEKLKKLWIRYKGIDLKSYVPFEGMKCNIKNSVGEGLSKALTPESIGEVIAEDVMCYLREEFQKLTLSLESTFSLSMNLMKQEAATEFTNFIFDYMTDKEIPYRKEIVGLRKDNDYRSYVYGFLKRKKCVICGEKADLHHWGSPGEYAHDDGMKTPFMPICRKHHTEVHAIGPDSFNEKYLLKGGIWLGPEEVEELKKVYKNHFKAYRGIE